MRTHVAAFVSLTGMVSACAAQPRSPSAPPPAPPVASPSPAISAPVPADPLGPSPEVVVAPPFQPPPPAVYTAANGLTVWLLERHALPVVAVTVVVPYGSSSDPKGEAGLADQAAQMLTEGAGTRGALAFARAVDDLGAKLDVGVSLDASRAHLGVLKKNFAAGLALLGDAVVRPRWDPAEWKRIHDLWENELKERASDAQAVANVVETATLFGADHPYGHPVEGFLASAPRVQLAGARRFCSLAWRPDRATIVVVGDVSRAELEPQIEATFGAWKAPSAAPLPVVVPPSPPSPDPNAKPRVVVVDHPDAPQAVIHVIRPGLAADDPRYPPLARANVALGGSFTSRLNHDLREERGWTYGAFSWVTAPRGVGTVGAGGAFVLEKSGEALKAMLGDVAEVAHAGVTEDEAAKTRMQVRSAVVSEYETVDGASLTLAHDAALGLGPDFEGKASLLADAATRASLDEALATFYGRAPGLVVAVGPRAELEASLTAAGFGPFEHRDVEGALKAAP